MVTSRWLILHGPWGNFKKMDQYTLQHGTCFITAIWRSVSLIKYIGSQLTNTLTLTWSRVNASDLCGVTYVWNDANEIILYSARDIWFDTRFMRIKLLWKWSVSFCKTLWGIWFWICPKRNTHKKQTDNIFRFHISLIHWIQDVGQWQVNGSGNVFWKK